MEKSDVLVLKPIILSAKVLQNLIHLKIYSEHLGTKSGIEHKGLMNLPSHL